MPPKIMGALPPQVMPVCNHAANDPRRHLALSRGNQRARLTVAGPVASCCVWKNCRHSAFLGVALQHSVHKKDCQVLLRLTQLE